MVVGYPEITIEQRIGYGQGTEGTDRLWGTCVECTKGTPFEPVLVTSPTQMYGDFKVDNLAGFYGVGGQGIYTVRVTHGTPVKAVHKLYDDAATAVHVLTLTAKYEGSYEITILAGSGTSGSNLTIKEDGMQSEYYLGISTIADLVARINRYSKIVDATFVAEGSGTLGDIATATVLGSGAGNTDGSDGDTVSGTDKPEDLGELANTEGSPDAVTAHALGLAPMANLDVKGVFSTSKYATVHDVYVDHAISMSTAPNNKWRYAVVGGAYDDDSKTALTSRAEAYDNEMVLFVGQGLIHYDSTMTAVEFPPYLATQAVAGKRSHLPYQYPIWGGEGKKILGYGGVGFFTELMPMVDETTVTTDLDLREYNEKGVITFKEDLDGIRLREGITTVQSNNTTMEDEEAVVSIIIEAKRRMLAAATEMLGQNITSTYKTDLENHIGIQLEDMKANDFTLAEYPDEQLVAYSVEATITPRSRQREGKVSLVASITPVHAARTITAQVTIY